jgi:NADH-quinone oxidoreductase subunit J
LFLAIASIFFALGSPFVAVLQIIIYAGAIMVLFVFVVMILNLGGAAQERERDWLHSMVWLLPVILTGVLLAEFVVTLASRQSAPAGKLVEPKAVGISLYTDYLLGVELASLLLVAALVAAYHFGAFLGRLEDVDE